MIDFYGQEKTVQPVGTIVTSEYAGLSLNGNMALLQGFQGNYARTVQTYYEAGSSNIYYIGGASEGRISANSGVSQNGFFANFRGLASNCGQVNTMAVTLKSSGSCSIGATGSMTFTGGMAENIELSYQAGPAQPLAQSIQIRVANLVIA